MLVLEDILIVVSRRALTPKKFITDVQTKLNVRHFLSNVRVQAYSTKKRYIRCEAQVHMAAAASMNYAWLEIVSTFQFLSYYTRDRVRHVYHIYSM